MFNLVQSLIARSADSRATSSSVKPRRRWVPHAAFAALGIHVAIRRGATGRCPDSGLDPAGSLANVTHVTPATAPDPAPPTPESWYIAHRQTPLIGSDPTTQITRLMRSELCYMQLSSRLAESLRAPASTATRPARRRSILPPVSWRD